MRFSKPAFCGCVQHHGQRELGTIGFISSYSASPPSATEEIRAETQAVPRSRLWRNMALLTD